MQNEQRYANAITALGGTLQSCVGFTEDKVIGIAPPGDNRMQLAANNGHRRKHAISFQSLLTPDGLIAHAADPLEGRRHDWTLYIRSSLDEQLANVLLTEGHQF